MDQQADRADGATTTTTAPAGSGPSRTARRWASRTGRSSRIAVPAAIGGTFLIATLALGAAGALPGMPKIGTGTSAAQAETARLAGGAGNPGATANGGSGGTGGPAGAIAPAGSANSGSDVTLAGTAGDLEPGASPSGEPSGQPSGEPSAEPSVDPTAEPSPSDSPDPTSAPTMHLVGSVKDGHPYLDWTACTPDGFHVYRIVRSSDSSVAWPLGSGDAIANGTENREITALPDPQAPAGHTFWYRAFSLLSGPDGELTVGCASNIVEVAVPSPTPEPTSSPDPTPEPTPTPTGNDNQKLDLTLKWSDGKVIVDWSPCTADGFNTYEVVRSLDSTVRWPILTDTDKVVATMGTGDTAFSDGDAPRGVTVYYRVFCVKIDGSSIAVLTTSSAKGITTPEPAAPSPSSIDLAANVTDGGNVELNWSVCPADGFIAEKVVRSASSNPSAVPLTDGSQVLATLTSRSTTHFLDTDVASGQHWFYRVQCLRNWYGDTIVGARSAVVDATLP
jgi:hypothetical protein